MVLADLGSKLTETLRKITNATKIDDKFLTEILNEITVALLSADVAFKQVAQLSQSVRTQVTLFMKKEGKNTNVKKLIHQTVVEELTNILDTERQPYEFKRGKQQVVMFVGLQGAGKTTTTTKFAYHYIRKGWKVALVCCDTFRAGAFDQLQQNAAKIRCAFYGNPNETNPVSIAAEGVDIFKQEKYEIIIVDTSGRHMQEDKLFEEMQEIHKAIDPQETIFVMDGSIGQACYDQATAFRNAVNVGSVIITKLDGHAKGGGALSAVAATNSPIIFLGVGETFDDLEPFEPKSFIKRLLGLGDLSHLFKTVQEAIPQDKQAEIAKTIQEGKFTLRNMKEQFQSVLNMGSLGTVMSMIPGMSSNLIPKGKEKEATARIKRFLYMMDSMNNAELDSLKPLNQSRIRRIARGSGTSIAEVNQLIEEHKKFTKMVGKMSSMGMNNPKGMQEMQRNPEKMMEKMSSAIDPRMVQQLGGKGNLMNMMKGLSSMEGMGDMMKMMGGARGGKGGRRK
jgi:signal recognition particle subunit SRP54